MKDCESLHISSCLSCQDLYRRIDQTRPVASLEDSQFEYGFNSNYLEKVVSYWRNDFDWRRQIDKINQYPHFKTKIEGEAALLPIHSWERYCHISNLFILIQIPCRYWCPLPACEAQKGARGNYCYSSDHGSRLAWVLSMSSTGWSHCLQSRPTRMTLCLRWCVPPYQGMVSLKHLKKKGECGSGRGGGVQDSSASLMGSCNIWMCVSVNRFWFSLCGEHLPQAHEASGFPAVLRSWRRLGLSGHHQHGPAGA